MRTNEGKIEKSSGRLMFIDTSRISSDAVMLKPRSRSSTAAGSGTTSIRTMETTPMGTAAFVSLPTSPRSCAVTLRRRVRRCAARRGDRQSGGRSVPRGGERAGQPAPPVTAAPAAPSDGVAEWTEGLRERLGSAAPAGLREALEGRGLEAGAVHPAAHAAGGQVHDEGQHPGDRGEQLGRHLLPEVA